jgi:hypothetical protein
MKIYVIVTGILFGLITLAHVARMIVEEHALATDPWYLLITALSAAFCAWAFILVRRSGRSS